MALKTQKKSQEFNKIHFIITFMYEGMRHTVLKNNAYFSRN